MVIYTTAQVINLSGQLPLRTVWAVDIVAYPEAASFVKQVPSGMQIRSSEYSGDQNNLREIDPTQFIDVGTDGRLTGERKELQSDGVRVRIPRNTLPEYEHIKLENESIKWYKETSGQWAFHDATAPDIERFIQKYLTNAELITKQSIKHIGEDLANKIAGMSNSDFVALMGLPDELPSKYNENYVIKKNGTSFSFANQNDVVKISDSRIKAFGTLQSNLNQTEPARIDSGILKTANSSIDITPGYFKRNYEGGPLIKLDITEFEDGGTYTQRRTLYGDKEWYRLDKPESYTDRYVGYPVTKDATVRAAWGGSSFLYTTHKEGKHRSVGRYDGQANPTLYDLLQSGGVFEVEMVPTDGAPGRPWDYADWNQIVRIRRIHDQVLHKERLYTKDSEGYIVETDIPFGPDTILRREGNSIVEYESNGPVVVEHGIATPFAPPSNNCFEDLNPSLVYQLSGDDLIPVTVSDPHTLYKGKVVPYTLCDLDLSEGRIYQYLTAEAVDDHDQPCQLRPYNSDTYRNIIDGWETDDTCTNNGGIDVGMMDPDRVYQVQGDALDFYSSSGPVVVNNGEVQAYVCQSHGTEDIPENVYVKKIGDNIIRITHTEPITLSNGIPTPYVCTPTPVKNSGGHLLAAALLGAGVKEVISHSTIYEEHADDESSLDN